MDQELFNSLVGVIKDKKAFQNTKMSVYDGSYQTESLGIALPRNLDRKIQTKLPWGKVAVDNLLQDLSFDGFKNDKLGFTKILKKYGGYRAIKSAQKNSMIGACSFLTILPGENGEPVFTVYTGAEGTGVWDSRHGFVAGLVENNRRVVSTGTDVVEDYLFFRPGEVQLVSSSGEVLQSADMPTDRMLFIPFIYGQDVAVNPFGESRLNAPFINALESGLRGQKNLDIASEINLSRGKVLLSEGALDNNSSIMVGDVKANVAELMMIKSVTGTTMKLEDLGTADINELRNTLESSAVNAATAVSMTPTAFGFSPSNGSYSEGTLAALSKPYTKLVEDSQDDYGDTIKEVAVTAMSLATGQYFPEWEDIIPVFRSDLDVDRLGAVGDGLGKILNLSGVNDAVSGFIDEKILGLSVAKDAMEVKLPDFRVAREAALKGGDARNTKIV